MANLTDYAKNISPALYQQLKQAVETGKWLDGNQLTEQQKEHSLQLVMAYQAEFNTSPQHFTVNTDGQIHMENKSILQKQFSEQTATDVHILDL